SDAPSHPAGADPRRQGSAEPLMLRARRIPPAALAMPMLVGCHPDVPSTQSTVSAARTSAALPETNGVENLGHGGAFPGVSTRLNRYPEPAYTVAVLSNLDASGAQ